MQLVEIKVLAAIQGCQRGFVFATREFYGEVDLHAITMALIRLIRKGTVRRLNGENENEVKHACT